MTPQVTITSGLCTFTLTCNSMLLHQHGHTPTYTPSEQTTNLRSQASLPRQSLQTVVRPRNLQTLLSGVLGAAHWTTLSSGSPCLCSQVRQRPQSACSVRDRGACF